jgi:hypothetical protein
VISAMQGHACETCQERGFLYPSDLIEQVAIVLAYQRVKDLCPREAAVVVLHAFRNLGLLVGHQELEAK